METTKQVKELDAKAEALRAEIERIESGSDEWTESDESRVDALAAQAWRFDDEARRIEATALLADPEFAAHVAATLESPEPGPEYPGDPMVWCAGREYFACEVIELATTWRAAA